MTLELIDTPRQVAKNPCLEKCKGACCFNMFLVGLSEKDLSKFTPPGTNVVEVNKDGLSIIWDEKRYVERGIYFNCTEEEGCSVAIIGRCPNLQPDFKCGKQEDKPEPCIKLMPGELACTKARKNLKLRSIEDSL